LGSSARKALKSAASKRLVGMNCQTIGPSFGPSSAMPLPMKCAIDGPASASTRRLVAKRCAFSVKTKPSGVSARHLAKLAGLKVL
jgi:hypothetical protein